MITMWRTWMSRIRAQRVADWKLCVRATARADRMDGRDASGTAMRKDRRSGVGFLDTNQLEGARGKW